MSLSPDHPKSKLLFYIVGEEVDDDEAEGMEELLQELAVSRPWIVGPPQFVDDIEEGTREDDVDLPLVGGVLETYQTHGLPREVDRALLEDVRAVVTALSAFSREYDLEIALEYDRDSIGAIKEGIPSGEVAEGFLGAWERRTSEAKP